MQILPERCRLNMAVPPLKAQSIDHIAKEMAARWFSDYKIAVIFKLKQMSRAACCTGTPGPLEIHYGTRKPEDKLVYHRPGNQKQIASLNHLFMIYRALFFFFFFLYFKRKIKLVVSHHPREVIESLESPK